LNGRECSEDELTPSGDQPDEISAEIDRVRDKAQAAFVARDVEAYMQMFSPDVVYKQKDGTALSYDRLAADVLKQLRVIPSIEIARERESFEVGGDRVVEVVTQSTSIRAPALFLLTRTIEISRKGRYVWSQAGDGWRIIEVEILSDDVKSHWALGFVKPRRMF
jgi:ketosteroid isomerase-like protein